MTEQLAGAHRPVVVVGAGQAGLSMSYWLQRRGVDHLVLEREAAGHEWRNRRWDSFCLVTPNWQCRLPGFPYCDGDPHGFMSRDEVVDYVTGYARSFDFPLVEGVEVVQLRERGSSGFELSTSVGTLTCDRVVVATGPYQVPHIPSMAGKFPEAVRQVHSSQYRRPGQLPEGEVLVVGTGQSGAQIAEDLHRAGRTVHLAVGSAPRIARFYRGRDVVAWLDEMGYYEKSVDSFDDVDSVRFRANHYVTGRGGGRDIDLRVFAREGMRLYGRLSGLRSGSLSFSQDLRENLDHADATLEAVKDSIDEHIRAHGIAAPTESRYRPVWIPDEQPSQLDLARTRITSVVWCTGFDRDDRWIRVPVFDGQGYPTHHRGVTRCPGLYFLGLPWQYTWGSGRFSGVGADAEHLTQHIVSAAAAEAPSDIPWIAGTPPTRRADDANRKALV